VVLAYSIFIRARLAAFESEIRRLLFPALDALVAAPEHGAVSAPDEDDAKTRVDARIPPPVAAKLSAIELHLNAIFDEAKLDDGLRVIGKRTETTNATEVSRVIGVSIRQAVPGIGPKIDAWRASNVNLIKSLAGKQLVTITKILERAEGSGKRVEVLRAEIEDTFGVTRAKADLLARDQTLKLNAEIAQSRQVAAGIESYVWTTSGDERVRETHAELDGTVQRWDTPPVVDEDGRTAHPGEDYQCRCTAFPVLTELE
jgi:SPP1 gp7 family putative phage head morphogenesis protein